MNAKENGGDITGYLAGMTIGEDGRARKSIRPSTTRSTGRSIRASNMYSSKSLYRDKTNGSSLTSNQYG